jgi:uncharacterized protein
MDGALLALPFGLLVGVLLGLVGGGGSILAVPILVYVLGQPAHDATTVSLLVVGTASLVGAVDHGRSGTVHLRQALVFGVPGTIGAAGGTALNRAVDAEVLLLAFAAVLLVAAAAMLRTGVGRESGEDRERRSVPAVAAAGLAAGLLTGFLGVGGGFVVVPALVVLLALPIHAAVGTSLVVIALTSAAAFVLHGVTGTVDLSIAVPFTAAAVAGVLVGRRVGTGLDPERLRVGFALLLVAVGLGIAADSARGLL